MFEKTRLEELSMALPEKERKDLLERIERRMEHEETEEPIPVELRENEREKLISHEMQEASAWVRFLLWLRTFLTGRPKKEVFIDIRLRKLKSHINSVNPGLTGFETRDLTPKLARRLYQVWSHVRPLVPVYHALGSDKTLRGAAYSWLIERRLEDVRRTVEEFVSAEEMEEIFAQTGQTEEIRKKLSLRLNEYVRGIPESFIVQLEEEAQLHQCIGRVTSYPFASLLRYFNYVLVESEESHGPSFEHAPAMLTLDLLEKLITVLRLVQSRGPGYVYADEPLAWYLLAHAGLEPDGENDPARVEPDLAHLRSQIAELTREIEQFDASVPLLDIVRYFRGDPWYQLLSTPPRLYLRSLYFSTLKARLADQLEEKLSTVKERVISRKIQEILKGHRFTEFIYFKEEPEQEFRKIGLPYIGCVRSLTLVYNYIAHQFSGPVQEAAQIVAATALANNRITQNRLMQNISGLEDLEARIVLYDRSFSPDEEDGKQLARLRLNAASDLVSQRNYRSFVLQKDREGRDLIEKAREHLSGIQRIFDEIRTSTFESTRSALKTLHVYRGRNQTLGQILNARSEALATFLQLLDQLVESEKGS